MIIDQPAKDKDGKPQTIWNLIVKKGPPTRERRWCCANLKESNGNDKIRVIGVRVAESRDRAKRYSGKINIFKGTKSLLPILYWTETDVWAYIEQRKIPYCKLYDEPGIDRLGCVLCPLASDKKRQADAQRWPKIAKLWEMAICRYVERRNSGKKPLPEHVTAEFLYRAHLGLPVYTPKGDGLFEARGGGEG